MKALEGRRSQQSGASSKYSSLNIVYVIVKRLENSTGFPSVPVSTSLNNMPISLPNDDMITPFIYTEAGNQRVVAQ